MLADRAASATQKMPGLDYRGIQALDGNGILSQGCLATAHPMIVCAQLPILNASETEAG